MSICWLVSREETTTNSLEVVATMAGPNCAPGTPPEVDDRLRERDIRHRWRYHESAPPLPLRAASNQSASAIPAAKRRKRRLARVPSLHPDQAPPRRARTVPDYWPLRDS